MRRLWLIAVICGVGFSARGTTKGFAQIGHDSGNETEVSRIMQRHAGDGGNELATVGPYMVLMAVFLGCGVYSFVANRSSTRKGR